MERDQAEEQEWQGVLARADEVDPIRGTTDRWN
jgi:hypothetical protein